MRPDTKRAARAGGPGDALKAVVTCDSHSKAIASHRLNQWLLALPVTMFVSAGLLR